MKIKIEITEVSHDNLVDLFSTALYGNNRWCADYYVDTYMKCKNIKQDECLEDKLARLILEGYPELGANFMSNKDKSDCTSHSCKCRKDVKVLKLS